MGFPEFCDRVASPPGSKLGTGSLLQLSFGPGCGQIVTPIPRQDRPGVLIWRPTGSPAAVHQSKMEMSWLNRFWLFLALLGLALASLPAQALHPAGCAAAGCGCQWEGTFLVAHRVARLRQSVLRWLSLGPEPIFPENGSGIRQVRYAMGFMLGQRA